MKVLKHRKGRLAGIKLKYEVQLKELFFLEGGGNMMEFVTWKKKPNILRDQYLKQHDLDSETSAYEEMLSPKDMIQSGDASKMDTESILRDDSLDIVEPKSETTSAHKQKESKSASRSQHSKASLLKPESPTGITITASPTRVQIPLSTLTTSLQVQQAATSTPKSTPSISPVKTLQLPAVTPSPRPATRSHASFSSVYESSHEDIVMRARQEAEVMRAIADLRREGLWSASRLPKVAEPPRRKTHWDYLLEEMQWLATDFANEKRWKINAAKKVHCWGEPPH